MSTQTVRNVAPQMFKEQFRCCICLDLYSNPVSIPCSHNFCMDCIKSYWHTKDRAECPLCKKTFTKRPELQINREFAAIIEFLTRATLEDDVDAVAPTGNAMQHSSRNSDAEGVPCDFCPGDEKSTSVQSCLVCQASYCERHLVAHRRVPALQRHRLTQPVTFGSSHLCRQHHRPLTMFCRQDQMPVCPQCTEGTHRHHKVVAMEKASKRVKTHMRTTKLNIQQMIQDRLIKMDEITKSVDLSKNMTEREMESGAQICNMLLTSVQRHQAQLVQELEERQKEAKRQAKQLLLELEQEVSELEAKGSELQRLELSQDPLHLLQGFLSLSVPPPTREWSGVAAVDPDNCRGMVRRVVGKLVDVCQELTDMLAAREAEKVSRYAVDVTLDPETASSWLVLSPDGKTVRLGAQNKVPVPDNPRRFDTCVCVLGKQSFKSGRRYWEVQVGDKTDWDLGVARESINRKGAIAVRPDSGFWAICRRKGGSLSACAGPSVSLRLQDTPRRVAVFLDWEEGSVSFYDAEAKTHVYTYSGCDFTEPLYPYFNPGLQDNGKNAAPLVICPLSI